MRCRASSSNSSACPTPISAILPLAGSPWAWCCRCRSFSPASASSSGPGPIAMPETLSLGDLIDMQIRQSGPMSLATYMGLCLTHPTRGYYRKTDPLGTKGDFITAPEISQTFGEIIGAWIADLYIQMDRPETFTILELGPGRGTLLADALRVATQATGLADALDLKLFETNPVLVAMQRDKLGGYNPHWIEDVEAISSAPIIVLANEFFDALPIRQFVKRNGKWYERSVGL